MWSLYEIDAELRRVLDEVVDHETGEINAEGEARIDALQRQRDKLVLDLACVVKEARAERDAIKEEIERLKKRAEACDKRAESVARQVHRFVQPGEKLKDPRVAIGWRRSRAIELLVSVDDLGDAFVRVKREPDLGALRETLESPFDSAILDGVAKIVERQHLQIR